MRITRIYDKTIPLKGDISNAVVSFADHTVSLVALVSDQVRNGQFVVGFGFNSIGRYAQSGILRDRIIPRVLGADPESLLRDDELQFDAAAIARAAMKNEKPGGHGDRASALGALELAVWDLNAKLADEPAFMTIAKAFGRSTQLRAVRVYAAGGYYYPGDSSAGLRNEFESYRKLGFDSFKMKIGGAPLDEDLRRIEVGLAVAGGGKHLAVDANGRFEHKAALDYARVLAPLELRWFEEPGDPLDYQLNRELTQNYVGAIATGENLFSLADTQNLIRYGGMRQGKDIFQMDAGLSYGLTEYARMIAALEAEGFDRTQCYPHGGHLINLHIAVGLELGGCEAYPGVFQPFGGYPAACTIGEGRVWPTDAPGFGLEQKDELRKDLESLLDNL